MTAFAELTGISRASLDRWERGVVVPLYSNVQRLERALGLKPGTLVFGPAEAKSKDLERARHLDRIASL